MNASAIGLMLIFLGAVLAVAGLILYLGGNFGFLGKLPGDIRVERDNVSFYFPITTSILISIILTALFYLLSRLK